MAKVILFNLYELEKFAAPRVDKTTDLIRRVFKTIPVELEFVGYRSREYIVIWDATYLNYNDMLPLKLLDVRLTNDGAQGMIVAFFKELGCTTWPVL